MPKMAKMLKNYQKSVDKKFGQCYSNTQEEMLMKNTIVTVTVVDETTSEVQKFTLDSSDIVSYSLSLADLFDEFPVPRYRMSFHAGA